MQRERWMQSTEVPVTVKMLKCIRSYVCNSTSAKTDKQYTKQCQHPNFYMKFLLWFANRKLHSHLHMLSQFFRWLWIWRLNPLKWVGFPAPVPIPVFSAGPLKICSVQHLLWPRVSGKTRFFSPPLDFPQCRSLIWGLDSETWASPGWNPVACYWSWAWSLSGFSTGWWIQ